MASFKSHLSFGVITGIAGILLASMYSLASGEWILAGVFVASVVGSALPDLDSDGGKPFRIVINSFSLLFSGIMLVYSIQEYSHDWRYLMGIPLASFFLFRFVVGSILKHFTHHRGIFHSVPAMLISIFGSMAILSYFEIMPLENVLLSCAVGLGYLSHLILDELKSSTNFLGHPFSKHSSLGSALKFTSESLVATGFAYVFLLVLIKKSLPILSVLI